MGRRDMEVGDAVAVNDNGCKGIGFVVASSDDPEKTGGVGAAGRTAYLIRWVLGKNLQHGTTMGARGESWLNDDPKRIRIDGVQGYTMPKRFMGRNVARLCKGDNEFIGLPAPHDADADGTSGRGVCRLRAQHRVVVGVRAQPRTDAASDAAVRFRRVVNRWWGCWDPGLWC